MRIYQNGKIIRINTQEDNYINIKAIMPLNKLDSKYAVKDEIYKMVFHDNNYSAYKYNFKVIQSQYSDDSSLDNYYMNFDTVAEGILRMLNDGFKVFDGNIELTRESLGIPENGI